MGFSLSVMPHQLQTPLTPPTRILSILLPIIITQPFMPRAGWLRGASSGPWVPLLRADILPPVPKTTTYSPPYPPCKTQVLDVWLRINAACARLYSPTLRENTKHLPNTHHLFPSSFHILLDGEDVPLPELYLNYYHLYP